MALGPKRSEEPYSRTDRQLLQSIASQTGLALENAELLEHLTTEITHRERVSREIEIAREVQQRLYPQVYPTIPGVDLAGYCRPAQAVGGDYYDFFVLPAYHGDEERLALALGDISGKGISAALLMASLRASLRSAALLQPGDLATLMRHVNRLVYESSTTNRYATFFYAELDPQSRVLTYVNAGHNPPVILRGTQIIRLEATGTVIGLIPDAPYTRAGILLEPGDALLCFTDGISEAMTHADEEWGEDRMIACRPATHHPTRLQRLRPANPRLHPRSRRPPSPPEPPARRHDPARLHHRLKSVVSRPAVALFCHPQKYASCISQSTGAESSNQQKGATRATGRDRPAQTQNPNEDNPMADAYGWGRQRNIPGVGTSFGPSLAAFNGRLYAAWKGINSDQGIYWASFDGNSWGPQHNIPAVGTSTGPSLCFFNGHLYAAWKGINSDPGIYWSFYDGNAWAPQGNIPGVGTSLIPSLAVFQNRLYAIWKGINNDQGLYFSSYDGNSWAPQRNIPGVGSSTHASLAVFQNRLYAIWKGINSDQGIYFSSFDGNSWVPTAKHSRRRLQLRPVTRRLSELSRSNPALRRLEGHL